MSKSGTGDGQRTKETTKNLKTKFKKTWKKGRKRVKNDVSNVGNVIVILNFLQCFCFLRVEEKETGSDNIGPKGFER